MESARCDFAAAFYLCANHASHDLRTAIFAYNHANWYVDNVLTQARAYSQSTPNVSAACPTLQRTVQQGRGDVSGHRALVAVAFACAQIGRPYVWGGDGPTAGEAGFDCSGLTRAAYAAAGIHIPRTAQTQYNAGPLLSPGTPLTPGDLLFFGTPGRIHHVGISLGGTLIVNAPTFGKQVQAQDYRNFRDYAGASRPRRNPCYIMKIGDSAQSRAGSVRSNVTPVSRTLIPCSVVSLTSPGA